MKNIKSKGGGGGFTLIELLVVIAIIGILSSVVLASLNSARLKSRDARRISDVAQMKIALELYADANDTSYPTSLNDLVTQGYLPAVPTDPSTGAAYLYAALGSGTVCSSYHIGATLEEDTNQALDSDMDATAGTVCTGSADDFDGTPATLYDIKP